MKRSLLFLCFALAGFFAHAQSAPLRGVIGTYDGEPRLPDGRMDLPKLLSELVELRANTYNFLIWHKATDWDDLKLFLPAAREKNISVWVTLVPPSESPPHATTFSEPFRLDFDRWLEELAKLSLKETNLVAWSVDDFLHDQEFFTPERVRKFLAIGQNINPRLAFVPCCYFRQITPETSLKYKALFDGVLFPYFAGSDPQLNLTNATRVEFEVKKIRSLMGTNLPIILDVYATGHANLGSTTAAYVQEVIRRGLHCCEGVLIYCHQDPVADAAKFQAIKTEFQAWTDLFARTRPAPAAAITSTPSARLERSQLLQYHRPDGRVASGKTKKHWQLRRAEILLVMQEVMGPWPGNAPRCPLNLKVEEDTDAGSYWRRLITYSAESGGRTPAYLLIPKVALQKNLRLPAVLALHSTEMSIGHKEVVGLGTPNHFDYGRELAERGFVVLAPAYPLMANYQPDLMALGYASGTMKAIWDNVRGLDLLDALPFVQPGKYGVVGHSLGGHNAIFTAVFEERLKVIVASCGFDSFVDYRHSMKDWAHPRYMPGIGRYPAAEVPFDFYELIGALAPRVCFISAPRRDTEFQWQSVDKIAAAARPVFALYGATKNLRVEHPDCAHEFPNELLAQACELLKTNLTFPK